MRNIIIYTDINPSRNLSICPSGLLEWITNLLERKDIKYNLINNKERLKKIKKKLIIVYPANKLEGLNKDILYQNKIMTLGPDSYTFLAYTVFKKKLSLLRLSIFKKIFFSLFIRLLDRNNLNRNSITVVVGEEDYRILKRFKFNSFYLPHPYLSGLKLKKPLPTNLPINGLILIGKLKGVSVGFRNLEPAINKFLLPLITELNLKLFIFESTNLSLKKIKKTNNFRIIKRGQFLNENFFQSKVVINLSSCGGGGANRSLSSLYDGAFLFSTKFGTRNIMTKDFKNQIYVSEYQPESIKFYNDLRKYISSLKIIDNTEKILLSNKKSELIFEDLINN